MWSPFFSRNFPVIYAFVCPSLCDIQVIRVWWIVTVILRLCQAMHSLWNSSTAKVSKFILSKINFRILFSFFYRKQPPQSLTANVDMVSSVLMAGKYDWILHRVFFIPFPIVLLWCDWFDFVLFCFSPLDNIEPKVMQYKLQEPVLLLGKVSISAQKFSCDVVKTNCCWPKFPPNENAIQIRIWYTNYQFKTKQNSQL